MNHWGPWSLGYCPYERGDLATQTHRGGPVMTEAGAGGSWVEQEEPRGLLAPGLWPPERGRMSFAQAPAARSPKGDTRPVSSPRPPRRCPQPRVLSPPPAAVPPAPCPRPGPPHRCLQLHTPGQPPCWTELDMSQSGPTAPPTLHHPTPHHVSDSGGSPGLQMGSLNWRCTKGAGARGAQPGAAAGSR